MKNDKKIEKLDHIVTRQENFAQWYTSIVNQAKLIQYSDVKGFIIFQPHGWAIWENIKSLLDKKFKQLEIKNVYMPLLIPLSDFVKEKEHVEGFAPELFTVTKIGDKLLEDPLVIRPTSEILFCKYFRNVINSYKDLPLKVNQWTSVLRAEKTTKPFLRNSEFHWHETHAVFADEKSAYNFTISFLNLYADFIEQELCIPVIKGEKTPGERFAGAQHTFTIETMMQDGQALQTATSHLLGQNFAKAYDIKYQSMDNKVETPFSTSHGLSTRIIGALIMVHGDDKGLVLPHSIAPIQIAILPLFIQKHPKTLVLAETLTKLLHQYRTEIDFSDKGIGAKIANQEVQGTPISIIIGPKDLEENHITIFRRDTNLKMICKINELEQTIKEILIEYKNNLFNNAKKHLDEAIVDCDNIESLKNILETKKWARTYFAGSIEDEKIIKLKTGATPRCIISTSNQEGKCFYTKKPTKQMVIFARAY